MASHSEDEAENGAILRAGHHRANNQDLGIGEDPYGPDQPGDDDQRNQLGG